MQVDGGGGSIYIKGQDAEERKTGTRNISHHLRKEQGGGEGIYQAGGGGGERRGEGGEDQDAGTSGTVLGSVSVVN